jgi:hypothetical protein
LVVPLRGYARPAAAPSALRQEEASTVQRSDHRSDVERLSQILTGTRYPAAKWQLIMQAEEYGADVATRAQLWALPSGTYRDLRAVLVALAAFGDAQPDYASDPAHARAPRPLLPVPGRVRPLR